MAKRAKITSDVAATGSRVASDRRDVPVSHVDERPHETMDDEEGVAAERGLTDMRTGRIATPEEVAAAFRRFGQ